MWLPSLRLIDTRFLPVKMSVRKRNVKENETRDTTIMTTISKAFKSEAEWSDKVIFDSLTCCIIAWYYTVNHSNVVHIAIRIDYSTVFVYSATKDGELRWFQLRGGSRILEMGGGTHLCEWHRLELGRVREGVSPSCWRLGDLGGKPQEIL